MTINTIRTNAAATQATMTTAVLGLLFVDSSAHAIIIIVPSCKWRSWQQAQQSSWYFVIHRESKRVPP